MKPIDADVILRQKTLEALTERIKRAENTVGTDSPFWEGLVIARSIVEKQQPAQPETATVTIGRTKGGVTLWHECNACGEPVDINDNYCRKCGRKLIHEDNTAQADGSGT